MQFSEYTPFEKKVKYTDAMLAESFEKHFGKSFKTVVDIETKKGYIYDSPNCFYFDSDDNEYMFDVKTGKWSYTPSHSEAFYNALFANIEGGK